LTIDQVIELQKI